MFGAYLYSLTPRDEQAAFPECVGQYAISQQNDTLLEIRWTVAQDKVLLLQCLSMAAIPGASNEVLSVGAGYIRNGAAPNIFIHSDTVRRAVNVHANVNRDFGPGLVLMPNDQLSLTAVFNSGAVANSLEVSFTGVLLPRGTFGFGAVSGPVAF